MNRNTFLSHNKKVIIMFYSNLFLIFSIFGYLYEMAIRLMNHYSTHNLLLGPWMPIYGIGIVIIELINQFLNQFKIKGFKKLIYCFLISIFILTILEWIGGILVLKLFSTSFWNYENIPFHIGKYVNVLVSILWGILSLFIEYIIIPILKPFIQKIPKGITILIISFILLDHLYLIITRLLQ